jgi:hypothetical protein
MHHKCPVDFHKELIELQRQRGKLKELLSIARPRLDRKDLVTRLREVRGEIARIELQLHARS